MRDTIIRPGAYRIPEVFDAPGDKSISHRAILIGALAPGDTTIYNLNRGTAVTDLLDPMRALGVRVEDDGSALSVGALRPPARGHARVPELFVGPSSAAARLLIGILAGMGISAVVDGSATLRQRPMDWLVDPLRALGANIEYLGEEGRLPIRCLPGRIRSGSVSLRIGSAQARSGVILAAAVGGARVDVSYPVLSRDHTERLLRHAGVQLEYDHRRATVSGGGVRSLPGVRVPVDPSLVAYGVARHILAGNTAPLRAQDVCLNPTRIGFFEVLRGAGADITYEAVHTRDGEPVGTVVARGGARLEPFVVEEPATFHALIDEVPLLAAIGACIPGTSRILNAGELSFKETNRLLTIQNMLRAFGACVEVSETEVTIQGGRTLRPGEIPSAGDHRIAMAATVLASTLAGASRIIDGTCSVTSFPFFDRAMGEFGCEVSVA